MAEPGSSEVAFTLPIRPDAEMRLRVTADYFRGRIPLKAFREAHGGYPVLLTDPLVIEPERGRYVVLTKFGGVVFWGVSERLEREIVLALKGLPGGLDRTDDVRDDLAVLVGWKEVKVTFDEIRLREMNLDKLKIISVALAQSVALDYFETEVSRVLQKFEPVVTALKLRGRLILSQRQVLKAVGFALSVRSAVLENLTLFDDPPETWESETLAHLDSQLYDHFDLGERLSAINQKLGYLNDVHALLMDMLNNRKSQRLEWIIILLIFIEIVFFVFYELSR